LYKTNLITEKIIAAFESMDLEWPELKTEKF
jgi:hypothetical protein